MGRALALLLYGLTFVAEGLLWLYRQLRPSAGPVFA